MLTGEVAKTWLVAIAMAVVTFLAFAGLDRCVFEPAWGHDRLHPGYDDWYGSLQRPGMKSGFPSCCSKIDCHETEAEMRGGDWWARLGNRHYLPGGNDYDWELQDWVKVPAGAVLQHQSNPTGNAVICHSVDLVAGGTRVSPTSIVFCFVPPTES